MFLSVRLAYPERGSFLWGEAIKEASRVGVVELAFVDPHTFLRLQNERIARSLEDVGLRVASIHMAHARLADFRFFLDVLFKTAALAGRLGCQLIVAHPPRVPRGSRAALEEKLGSTVAPALVSQPHPLLGNLCQSRTVPLQRGRNRRFLRAASRLRLRVLLRHRPRAQDHGRGHLRDSLARAGNQGGASFQPVRRRPAPAGERPARETRRRVGGPRPRPTRLSGAGGAGVSAGPPSLAGAGCPGAAENCGSDARGVKNACLPLAQ